MEIKILTQNPDRRNKAVSALFKKDGEWYYADLVSLPLYGNECMIFPANKNGKVTDYSEVYCNRSMDSVNEDNLRLCIEEFCTDLRDALEVDL